MNGAQKAVFACGLIVAVLMGLFPPWVERVDRLPGGESPGVRIARPIGYGSLFSPPEAPSSQNTELAGWYRRMYYVTVDLKRLFVQEGIVIVATAGVMLLLKGGGGSEPISAERKG